MEAMLSPTHSTLKIGVAEIIEDISLTNRLQNPTKVVVKLGIDPTSVDLHLGHAVVLRKLRQFQDFGCQTVLVIGDFTATIGDPAGVNTTRPVLSEAQVKKNMTTYFAQAGKIIDLKKSKIVYNSTWLKRIDLGGLIRYAEKLSVNNLIDREDFQQRLKKNQNVGLHEFLYPLAQAIDSVELKADIELGGYDQRLNLLTARQLQKKSALLPEDLVMMKLLIGTDGSQKMSSSKNNFIPLEVSADEMYGKIMSIPDSQIVLYGELAAWLGTADEVKKLLKKFTNLRDQKAYVAKKTVELFFKEKFAQKAEESFNQTFRDKNVVDHLARDVFFNAKTTQLLLAVKTVGEFSTSQAMRLIAQDAVSLDGVKKTDPNEVINLDRATLLKIGKHTFAKLNYRR